MFGRATIRLGIGPHSSSFSYFDIFLVFYHLRQTQLVMLAQFLAHLNILALPYLTNILLFLKLITYLQYHVLLLNFPKSIEDCLHNC